jgi:NAD(P)-dependent dehydrogenase (short-subunit alcohol dehydrogenase family)
MSALHPEVEPFGIATTVVNPGFFRPELISEKSMVYAEASIDDYDDRRAAQEAWWQGQAGQQPGDPGRLAQAVLRIAEEKPPPRRFIAGADVVALAERKADELRAQADVYRDLSTSMGYDD